MDQQIDNSEILVTNKQTKTLQKVYLSTNKILKLYIKEIEKETKRKKSLNLEINKVLNDLGYNN